MNAGRSSVAYLKVVILLVVISIVFGTGFVCGIFYVADQSVAYEEGMWSSNERIWYWEIKKDQRNMSFETLQWVLGTRISMLERQFSDSANVVSRQRDLASFLSRYSEMLSEEYKNNGDDINATRFLLSASHWEKKREAFD